MSRLEEAGGLDELPTGEVAPSCGRDELEEGPCGNCDNCDAGRTGASAADGPFAVGARVEHADWEEGAVQRYDGDQMTVLSDSAGYKTLSVALVVDGDLLALRG